MRWDERLAANTGRAGQLPQTREQQQTALPMTGS